MPDDATPITSAAAAERWAIELLHGLADALAALPHKQRADALRLLVPSLSEVDRVATRLGIRK